MQGPLVCMNIVNIRKFPNATIIIFLPIFHIEYVISWLQHKVSVYQIFLCLILALFGCDRQVIQFI